MRISIVLIVALAAIAASFFFVNRPVTISIAGSLPQNFPDSGFSHQGFEALLLRFVDASGDVDYDAWHASRRSLEELDGYLAAVAAYSPDSTPERFPTRNDELAYWMYAYNGYVIRSVLTHWPIESVTDVKAPLEAVKGLGFFYRNRFVFGGEAHSLLTVENDFIRRRFRDPRIHFILNCASDSCPVLRPRLPAGDELENLLAEATRQFITDPRNVSFDHANKVIRLSAIFEMYEQDFINHVRAAGRPVGDGVLTYISNVAPEDLQREIEKAHGYAVEFQEFDWGVNASGGADAKQAVTES